jgi:hypothetical protein
MGQRSERDVRRSSAIVATNGNGVVERHMMEQLRLAFAPQIRALIKEVIADETVGSAPLIVDYTEAGRLIGTTYEGVRKLVRKGMLTAVSRSGRNSRITSNGGDW